MAYLWPGSAVVIPTAATALEDQIATLLAAASLANAPAEGGGHV